jgi:hypothetical protein
MDGIELEEVGAGLDGAGLVDVHQLEGVGEVIKGNAGG